MSNYTVKDFNRYLDKKDELGRENIAEYVSLSTWFLCEGEPEMQAVWELKDGAFDAYIDGLDREGAREVFNAFLDAYKSACGLKASTKERFEDRLEKSYKASR